MTARKRKISCDVDIELAEQFQDYVQQTGRSNAAILREMIEQHMTTPASEHEAVPPASDLALNTDALLAQITTALQTQLDTFAAQLPPVPATDSHAILSELEYLGDRIANLEALFQTMIHPDPEPSPPLTPTAPRSIAATVLDFPPPPPPDMPPEPSQPQESGGLTLAELYEQTFLNPDLIRPMADYLEITEAEFIEMRTGWRYDYISQRWYV
jgi:hypothetical protein